MHISSGLSSERSHADIGIVDDSVMIRADAQGHTPGPAPAATDFPSHIGAFDADAGAAGHMVKAFGDGATAADGDGVDGGAHGTVEVSVGPIEYLNGSPAEASETGSSQATHVEVSVGPIECLSDCPAEIQDSTPSDASTDLVSEIGGFLNDLFGEPGSTENAITDGIVGFVNEVGAVVDKIIGDGNDEKDTTSKDTGDQTKQSDDTTNSDQQGSTDADKHDGTDIDQKSDDTKDQDKEPETDPVIAGPTPEGSTPDPDDDGSGSKHLPGVGNPSASSLSEKLAAVGNSQDGSAGNDGSHGPHDPGEEMPNPEAGGGSPTSNSAHGGSFWDQAAPQGSTTGLHLSTSAVSDHAVLNQIAHDMTATTTAHDVSGELSDTSAHSAHSVTIAHDAVHADLHTGLGTSTFHDSIAISSGTFAHQMHV